MAATISEMPRRAKEKTATIRVTERVLKMIETICLAEDANSSEVASPILEKALIKRYHEAVDAINEARDEFKKE